MGKLTCDVRQLIAGLTLERFESYGPPVTPARSRARQTVADHVYSHVGGRVEVKPPPDLGISYVVCRQWRTAFT